MEPTVDFLIFDSLIKGLSAGSFQNQSLLKETLQPRSSTVLSLFLFILYHVLLALSIVEC